MTSPYSLSRQDPLDLKDIRSSLLKGDNEALRYIYMQYGDYCINTMISQRSCGKEEAEDLFIEAVLILREKVMEGKIEQLTNTKYYLYKTCENIYLARLKSDKRKRQKLDDLKYFYYQSSLVEGEEEWDARLQKAAKQAWQELTEKCRDILNYFYVDSLRMTEIMELMDFASADVAKTTKARCYKKLMVMAKAYYADSND